jgi:aspartyl-tRNA(Asn)/glutamyl-tRNA(Gln) amidotransferase subunit A
MSLHALTLHELHQKLKKKEVTATEVTKDVFQRIEAVEDKIHSYVHTCRDLALEKAKAADKIIQTQKDFNPLTGVPFGLKDIFLTEGIATTCSSKILAGYLPPYTATSAQKLMDQNIVLTGKFNMDEFAMGSSNETSYFGATKNPWDIAYIPGGSSGGSASAVAAGSCFAALGTDTGGSIRQPASHCGIVGLKPTYGRVSRYGVIAFASSLDQVGPMTKDVTDCALVLQAIAGWDPKDSTSLNEPVPDYTKALKKNIKGLKIGIPQEYFMEGTDPEVTQAVEAAIETYKKLGATCKPVSLPHTEYAVSTYYILAPAEASSNLSRYDGVRYGYRHPGSHDLIETYKKTRTEGFGNEVKRRIMLGTYVLSAGYYDAYYLKAQKVRTLIRQDFTDAFQQCDVLLTPCAPTPAFKIGEKTSDPLQMYLSDIFTINVNLAGLPGLSLPCGFSNSGLPIGMQLIGPHLGEEKILHAGYAYEQATEWHTRRAAL